MAAMSLFAPVAKDRVTPTNPASTTDDLAIDRCAALHNTLLLYGWICSGKKIFELQKRSWWSNYGNETLKQKLRPSVVRYLSKVFDVPFKHSLFYHVSGIARPKEMLKLGDVLEDVEHDHDDAKAEKHRFIVLYATNLDLVTQPAGIVYDQQAHKAILMPTYHHLLELTNPALPWQKLEAILSAYIDMVEAEKAVAIPDSVSTESTDFSGHASRKQYKTRPWILQPYTLSDLHACLGAWQNLVRAIEKRAGIAAKKPAAAVTAAAATGDDGDDPNAPDPLCSRAALDVAGIPRGFAYELLSHARQSNVWFLAPGIRLPKVEEFLHQPFKHVLAQYPKETEGMKMPFLFLPCPGTVSAQDAKFRYPFSTVESVPAGLYLDAFANAANPFEDACRLVLPIRLGSNKYARTSDFKPIRRSYSDLYQTDLNPFVMRHGPKLAGILENWLANVESGHWSVNEKGVEGGIGMWRRADTREDWWRYQSSRFAI
ncbi:hypothetical protein LTR36_009363 [Oleoguttula mirabilis]|uniref:Proteophosphoglycan ppg4 n=1 Tax=Oleoguttula mirabilis TaxID=1507867 RepID=A0AAV9JV34_9PEZI|nr:hypothetical protein LTR36_009363 [Oleoguttula mirabilis]